MCVYKNICRNELPTPPPHPPGPGRESSDPICTWPLRAAPTRAPCSQVQPPSPSTHDGTSRAGLKWLFPSASLRDGEWHLSWPAKASLRTLPPCKEQSDRAPGQASMPLTDAPTPQAPGSPHTHGALPFGQNAPAERQLHRSPASLVRSCHLSHSEDTHTPYRALPQRSCPPHIPHPGRARHTTQGPHQVTHLPLLCWIWEEISRGRAWV